MPDPDATGGDGRNETGRHDTGRKSLRIGDAERGQVIDLLQHAVGDGRLTMSEGSDRIDSALAARTYGDLDPLVADLTPVLPSMAADVSSLPAFNRPLDQVPGAGQHGEPGWSQDDPLVLSPGWDSVRRVGEWDVPPFIRVEPGVGSTTLVMLEARAKRSTISMKITGGMGSIRLIVPPGWAVTSDRLSNALGSVRVRTRTRPAHGSPLVVLHGTLGASSFVARYPNWFDRWLLERRGRRRQQRELEG